MHGAMLPWPRDAAGPETVSGDVVPIGTYTEDFTSPTYLANRANLYSETACMGPRSAAIPANTLPNSQLLSLFADLLYVDQVGDGLQRQIGRRHLVGAAFELSL